MTKARFRVARLFAALLLAIGGLSPALADDAAPAVATPEAATLQSYGASNLPCLEWNDGCATCLRDAAGAAHCSTPGIACQSKEIVCARKAP